MSHDDMQERTDVNDQRIDAVVARFASDYNAPPPPPVEAMWTRIAASGAVGQGPVPQSRSAYRVVGLVAASLAILGVGVVIGRSTPGASRAGASPVASAATTPDAVAPSSPAAASPDTTTETSVMHAPSRVDVASTASTRRAPVDAMRGDARDGSTNDRVAQPADRANLAFQVATIRHFTEAEALLTAYASDRRDAKTDAQLAAWAAHMLTQTRLLLDSPAGADPVRRKLLGDLELVLVQMTELGSGTERPLDHDLIDGTTRRNDILGRLRNVVPAGAATQRTGA